MKTYKLISLTIFTIFLIGCSENKKNNQETENVVTKKKVIEEKKEFKIEFDKTKISTYKVINIEKGKTKTLTRKLSEYSTKELEKLPNSIRHTFSITVPFDISKESLNNTLKYIVDKTTKQNNDIDEIIIFAYDDKKDIGKIQYTYGKLSWLPNGKKASVTPEIANKNIRNNYKFDIIIKEKVGKVKKADLPTKRELKIYNEIMSDKYVGYSEDKLNKTVMRKFNIKTEKELNKIWLKVAAFKN